jgi:hypothetical protein
MLRLYKHKSKIHYRQSWAGRELAGCAEKLLCGSEVEIAVACRGGKFVVLRTGEA